MDEQANGRPMIPNPTLSRSAKRGRRTEDEKFLRWTDEDRRRAAEFTHTDTWRVLRIMGEFVEGFDELADIGPAVSVFGSARVRETDPMYARARDIGARLALAGFTTITGGGPGKATETLVYNVYSDGALNQLLGQFKPCRTTVNDDAQCGTMRLTPGGDTENLAEGAPHTESSCLSFRSNDLGRTDPTTVECVVLGR